MPSHLTSRAAALLNESDEQRIKSIRSQQWINYPRALQALARLHDLIEHPRGTRMPSIAIYGDSGMGKTMIMKRFENAHPPTCDPTTNFPWSNLTLFAQKVSFSGVFRRSACPVNLWKTSNVLLSRDASLCMHSQAQRSGFV